MNLKLTDYLLLLGIVLILLVGIFLISYYFNYQNNECFQEPLVYGAKQLEDKFNAKFSGFGYLRNEKRGMLSVSFDSEDILITSSN